MKKAFILILFLSFVVQAKSQTTITTFIIVRHAEKGSDGSDDPDLKPEGLERAKKLASLLTNTKVDAVFSTRYKRTKNTVVPTASEKKLEVQIYDAVKADFIDGLLSRYAGQTILVGGHSNTVPQLVNLLMGTDEYKTFPDSEYGNLFIVSVVEREKSAKVTILHY